MANEAVTGVVLEVGVAQGVDVLAVYANRSARFDGCAGATVIWQRADQSLDVQIDGLLKAAAEAVDDAVAVESDRIAIRFGEARILWLLADGVRGIHGSMVALLGQPPLAAVLRQGSALTRALVARAGAGVA